MTANLLAYQRNVEEARHNAEMERLQGRSIAVSATQAQAALTNAGASVMQAQTAQMRAAEEVRHNEMMERYNKIHAYSDAGNTLVNAAKFARTLFVGGKTDE